MAELVYSTLCSLDGYTEDAEGKFGWAAPDAAVHTAVNDLERGIGTYLYGRRMYETMVPWEGDELVAGKPQHIADYAAIWRATDKVVYSRTLDEPSSERTRIVREFDPDEVRRMKEAAERDISVGGPELAAQALRAGLVDKVDLFLARVVVGAGKAVFPAEVRLELELLDERRFASGFVHLSYRVRS